MSMLRSLSQKLAPAASSRALSVAAAAATSAPSEVAGYDRSLLRGPATKVTTLPNGVRVATEESLGQTASVGVFIDAGSRFESKASNGAAHFLEHLSFKGTAKRSRVQLEREVENIGGHLNAYTSREQTVYYAKCFQNDVPQAVDLLGDILLNSTLDEAAIEAERHTILREMEDVESNIEEVIFDRLHTTAFRDQGLGYTILGPVENINSLKRKDLVDYTSTHYTGDRMVVVGSGAVKHEELVQLANKAFGNLKPSSPFKLLLPGAGAPAPIFTGSEIRHRDDTVESAHLAVAFKGVSWTHEDAFTMMVMQSLLGSWDSAAVGGKHGSSRLTSRLAEEGVASRVMTFNTHYKDTGLFGFYVVMPEMHAQDVAYHCMSEVVRLCHRTTDEEVERARLQLKTQLLMNLDNTSQVCEDIGRQLLTYGRRLTPLEICARIDAVDAADVRQVAFKTFHDQEIAVSALGPLHGLPDFNWLRRRTYWLRY